MPENESEISKYEIVLPKRLSRCKRTNLNAHKMKTDDNFTKLAGKTYITTHPLSLRMQRLYIIDMNNESIRKETYQFCSLVLS